MKIDINEALQNHDINLWEYKFLTDTAGIAKPSTKQKALINKITSSIKNVDEDKRKENKEQDAIASVTMLESGSKEEISFLDNGHLDAKIAGHWFRECECCGRIKKKEVEFESSWRKNRKRRGGGQVTYSRRCYKCEDEVGHKWGDTDIKLN